MAKRYKPSFGVEPVEIIDIANDDADDRQASYMHHGPAMMGGSSNDAVANAIQNEASRDDISNIISVS